MIILMEKTINDFSLSLLIWQLILITLIIGIFLILRKYFKKSKICLNR